MRDVAVKLSIGEQRIRTRSEAYIMRSMAPHPAVLPVLRFEESAESTMLVTPLATGGDTLKLMQARELLPLPAQHARDLFAQLVDALSHVHKNGFVHRDIKCENILLTGPLRRQVLLADFGFAARWSENSQLSEPWGSLHYSSPEIAANRSYKGPEVDVWSLGVVLYAWSTGRLPFGNCTEDEMRERIVAGSYALPASLGPDLADLIKRMLTREPEKRITLPEVMRHAWLTPNKSIVGSVARSASDPIRTPHTNAAIATQLHVPPTTHQQVHSSVEVATTRPSTKLAKVLAKLLFRKR